MARKERTGATTPPPKSAATPIPVKEAEALPEAAPQEAPLVDTPPSFFSLFPEGELTLLVGENSADVDLFGGILRAQGREVLRYDAIDLAELKGAMQGAHAQAHSANVALVLLGSYKARDEFTPNLKCIMGGVAPAFIADRVVLLKDNALTVLKDRTGALRTVAAPEWRTLA